jgi:hypothetical protein
MHTPSPLTLAPSPPLLLLLSTHGQPVIQALGELTTSTGSSSSSTSKTATFEWILAWSDFGHLVTRTALQLPTESSAPVLEIGGGTSEFAVDLLRHGGYDDVTSVDHDAECVAHMQALHPSVTWRVADITTPKCESAGVVTGKFALVVDKGTLDCVLVEAGPHGAVGLLEQV